MIFNVIKLNSSKVQGHILSLYTQFVVGRMEFYAAQNA
jgi:hypothetical protein